MNDSDLSFVADEGRSEFDASRRERNAIETPTRTTFDVIVGYQLVGTSLPRIIPYKEQLAKLMGFDVSLFDRVLVYGRAAMFAIKRERANGVAKSVAHPKLVEEMERLYFRFYKTAEYLVAMGLLDAQILTAARTGTSVVARSTDLGTLSLEFASARDRLGASLILTAEELSRGAKVSREIIDSLIDRSNAERAPSEFRHDRQRAAMVFFNAWEEIRRAIHWLRWYEGDASELAPSLFSSGDRRAHDGGDDGEEGSDKGSDDQSARKPAEPAGPMPADKREELARSGEGAAKRVPQEDPFVR